MKKDYSEYKHTDYEKYNIARQSNSYVYYDFFINFASFDPDSKLFSIKVDRVNEDLSMKDAIDEFEELERSLREVHPDILSDEDIALIETMDSGRNLILDIRAKEEVTRLHNIPVINE